MRQVLVLFILLLQGLFCDSGWVIVDLHNIENEKACFYIPRRYYQSVPDSQGHGTLLDYDLIGTGSHISFSNASSIEFEMENWEAEQVVFTDTRIVKKGIRDGLYWRYDIYLRETGGRLFTLCGFGKDSLEINHILDSAKIIEPDD